MQTKDPINTFPIQQFIQQTKTADASNQKEVKLDLQTAKNLSYCLGIVMARLAGDYENLLAKNVDKQEDVISISVDGGGL